MKTISASAPAYYLADLKKIDSIAARPGVLMWVDGESWFDSSKLAPEEISFINNTYIYGYARGWLGYA